MKMKKIISVFLALMLFAGIGLPQFAAVAHAEEFSYKIIYHGNGGIAVTGETVTQSVTAGKTVTLTNTFSRAGYGFGGWSLTENGEVAYESGAKVTNLAPIGEEADLYAVWNPYYYTVKYDLNGLDGEIADENAAYDADLKNIKDLSRVGYDFLGWNTKKTTTAKYKPGTAVKNVTVPDGSSVPEVTLYAIWQAHTATVNFDANTGTGTMASEVLTYNAVNTLSANAFKKTGYTFMGWSLTPAGEAVYADTAVIADSDVNVGFAAENGNEITLYAVWQANTYTVIYNLNGYDEVKANEAATYDVALKETTPPQRPGYSFLGWALSAEATTPDYKAGREIINLASKAGAAVTLYAVWQANTYSLTFKAGSGVGEDVSQSFTYDKKTALKANTFTKIGYVFAGWGETANGEKLYDNSQSVSNLTTVDKANLTLYALWRPLTYTVKYNTNGLSADIEDEVAYYDSPLKKAAVLSCKGHTFLGWNIKKTTAAKYAPGEEIKNLTQTNGDTVTLYAIWLTHTATVHYDANTGTGTMENSTVTYGLSSSLTENAFKKTGYTFMGWSLTPGGEIAYANAAVIADTDTVFSLETENGKEVTLYAVWQANTYTVIYNLNGYDAEKANEAATYDVALKDTTPPQRPGYAFLGWALSAEADAPDYKADKEIMNLAVKTGAAVTLYAVWQANTYSLTFKAGSGTGEDVAQTLTYDKKASLKANTFTKTGYLFAGWSETPDGVKKYEDSQSVINLTTADKENITLYALWRPVSYTVKYNTSGITADMDNEEAVYDTCLKGAGILSHEGYTFLGWNTKKTTVAKYAPGEEVKNLTQTEGETVTLYAIWQTHTYTVVFKENGGTGSMNKLAMTYGVAAALTSNSFKKTGYTFKGWSTEPNGEPVYDNGETVSNLSSVDGATVTLYAVWKANTYTVIYDGNDASNVLVSTGQTFTYDKEQALWNLPYRKAGYIFTGWTLEKGKDVLFTNAQVVKNLAPSGSITLIAVWTKSLMGDVNLDNKVGADDARLVLRATVGLENLTENQKTVADVDKDTNITAADARLILRATVGLETLK